MIELLSIKIVASKMLYHKYSSFDFTIVSSNASVIKQKAFFVFEFFEVGQKKKHLDSEAEDIIDAYHT